MHSAEMLLFVKGNIDCLVQERARLSSVPAPRAVLAGTANTDGLTTQSRLSSTYLSPDNNPMRGVRLLLHFTDEETEVQEQLFAQVHTAGTGQGTDTQQQIFWPRARAAILSAFILS